MERKKSKHGICFPMTLDMDQFLGSPATRKATANSTPSHENIYELRGVLLHKGSSAYHGHYEAQVYDTPSQSWFQFNDEAVTKITSLGDKKRKEVVIDLVDSDEDDIKYVLRSYSQHILSGSSENRRRNREQTQEKDAASKTARMKQGLTYARPHIA